MTKISLNSNGSNTDSRDWIKINKSKNNDNKYFQYAITAALNHENIGKHPGRIVKIRSLINRYEWKERNLPTGSKEWKKFETNNQTISLNVLFSPNNKEEIKQAYISKHKSKREYKVILLMIVEVETWHYLAMKNIQITRRNNRR